MRQPLCPQIFKLRIAVGMGRRTFNGFGVDMQTIVMLMQQATDHGQTDRLRPKLDGNVRETTVEPLGLTHGIATRMWLNQLQQGGF